MERDKRYVVALVARAVHDAKVVLESSLMLGHRLPSECPDPFGLLELTTRSIISLIEQELIESVRKEDKGIVHREFKIEDLELGVG